MTVRPRRDDDLPELVDVLTRQQAGSHYPYRWPLPMPVVDFVRRAGELAAWVVEVDGQVVAHASLTRCAYDAEGQVWAAAHGVGVEQLAVVSALFVAPEQRGQGLATTLLDTCVAEARALGLRPCLDTLARNEPALRLYLSEGWEVVGETRFDWLPDHEKPSQLLVLRG